MRVIPYNRLTRTLARSGFLARWVEDPDIPDFHPPQSSVFDYQIADLRKIAGKYGHDVSAYPGLAVKHSPEAIFFVLNSLCSWKYINEQPMSAIERFTLALPGLWMEVNNGGFHQYFFNSAGDDWDSLLWGLEAAGDSTATERFKQVLAIFPAGKPFRNRAYRWKQLEALGDSEHEIFDPHTREFFESPFPEREKTYRFIFSRIHEFAFTWPIRPDEQTAPEL